MILGINNQLPVKQQAITLRQQGKTYREISECLPVSIDWCKRNLKDIQKGETQQDKVKKAILAKALSKEGCTDYELIGILKEHFDEDKVIETIRKLPEYKRSIKKLSNKALFRPQWMDPGDPQGSNTMMNECANELFERLDDIVQDFVEKYPGAMSKNVRREIIAIVFGYTTSRCEYNQRVADSLSAPA